MRGRSKGVAEAGWERRAIFTYWALLITGLLPAGCAPGQSPASAGPAPETPVLHETPFPPAFPFMDPNLSLEERVEDLLGRLTLEEKVSQTLYNAPAIPRLGIPAYNWWNEALHGVARAGIATVFPQAIGLAATWDPEHLHRVATAISDEARAKHHQGIRRDRRGIYEGLTFWSPNINLFRDPRWGRGMETYGEDPFLTGRLSVAFVQGMQGDHPFYLKTVATPKHYAVHSGPEPERHTFNAAVSERDLRETYLPAFRQSVMEGGAESVMCAYNAFRGHPACASSELLQDILREDWGFDGYVVSDCWAISDIYNTHRMVDTPQEAAAMAMAAGADLNCGVAFDSLGAAIRKGMLPEEVLDTSVRRLFRARFRLGMFDPPEWVPWANTPYDVNDSPQHRALALESARKSMVLLKNDGNLLPLQKDLITLAVIGPNADDVEVLLGNYNGIPRDPVTPLRGIRKKVEPGTRVLHARGADHAAELPHLETIPPEALRPRPGPNMEAALGQGLIGQYFSNTDLAGEPILRRVDPTVDFRWWGTPPLEGLETGGYSIRWTGALIPPAGGEYAIGGKGLGDYRIYVNDSLAAEFRSEHEINTQWSRFRFPAGEAQDLRVEFSPRRPHAAMQLVWAPPRPGLQAEALEAVSRADAVILVMGLSPRLEGEEMRVEVPGFGGGDRVELGLPAVQKDLVAQVAATGRPVVLVLMNGSALAIPEEVEKVSAVLEAWYPGQAGGTALADILFGDYNPGGRLPVTFYRSGEDLPPFADYAMAGRTYRYFAGDPLYAFGHGLSYTTFTYGHFTVPDTVEAGAPVEISVTVGNTGNRAGEEVVQLYLTDEEASAPVPIRSLQGLRRIHLEAGEVRRLAGR